MKHISNRLCTKKFKDCSIMFDNVILTKEIGSGTFGTVYNAHGTYNSKKYSFAIKEIKNMTLNHINNEYLYSLYMSDTKLGPRVFDGFYFQQKSYIKAKSDSPNTKIPKGKFFTQYIFMEKYKANVFELLFDQSLSLNDKKLIINKMIILLYNKIFYSDVMCYDIKPGNYVFKIVDNNIDIRLIDFGQEFCEPNTFTKQRRIAIFILLMIQLAHIIKKLPNIKKALPVFNQTSSIFKNRLKYLEICYNELVNNNKMYDNYSHYTRKNKSTSSTDKSKQKIYLQSINTPQQLRTEFTNILK